MTVTVLADTAPEWWQVILDVLTAVGTVGAVIVALITGAADRRAADRRAEDDRKLLLAQQLDERQHEQRQADARWRLDLLTAIAATFERRTSLGWGSAHDDEEIRVLVRAYPGRLPTLWAAYVEPRPTNDTGEAMLRRLRAAAEPYEPEPPTEDENYFDVWITLVRLELQHKTAQVRDELLPRDPGDGSADSRA